jgi:ATP-dependent helicase/nuclease subunit B
MTEQQLFTPSTPLRGRSAAMAWAAERSSGLPHSVLYICPPEVRDETLVDQWEQHGPQLALQTARFDSVVDRLYEHDTHEGQSTYGSQADRQLVIEAALSRLTDETHPLYCDGEPSVGLVQQAENVLSLLEFAGLDSEKAVRERLIQVDVDHLADPLAEFTATVHAIHHKAFTRTNTFRGERYLHVIQQGDPLAASVFSEVDVVIVGAFQTLSPLERDLIDVFSSVFDTAIVSARVTPETASTGVDTAISRISTWYAELGFSPDSTQDSEPQAISSRSRAAASLYQYADPETEQSNKLGDDVGIETHATIRHEVDAIARQVR